MPQPFDVLPGMMQTPIAGGIAPSMQYGFSGVPGMNSGPFGSVGMFLQPKLAGMMGQHGFTPLGFGHDQNVYDTLRKQEYTRAQMRAVQLAAQSDRENMMDTFRGMSLMAGTGFGAKERRAASTLTDIASTASPFLVNQNAELLDQLGGQRGSNAVMTQRIMDASRYRIDAVTGRTGVSAENAAGISNNLYRNMFRSKSLTETNGLSAGTMGSLFQELQSRGMVAGPGDRRENLREVFDNIMTATPGVLGRVQGAQKIGSIAERQGVDMSAKGAIFKGTPGEQIAELDKLAMDPEIATRLQAMDANKIKKSLSSYTSAVKAIKDIFGDMGRRDAPMQELMSALDALTGNSMHQMDPGKISTTARMTYNLAKNSGVTLDNAMLMQQHASARAQSLGLSPLDAVNATQQSLAFGQAYRSLGMNTHTSWGAMSADEMTQLDLNMNVQAAASPLANQIGAVMRLNAATGGFKKGSEAARYAEAIKLGRDKYVGADGVKSINVGTEGFLTMMKEAGIEEGQARDMLDQVDANRDYANKHNAGRLVSGVQREDAIGFVSSELQGNLFETLRKKVGDDKARDLSSKLSGNIASKIFNLKGDDLHNNVRFANRVSEMVNEELKSSGSDVKLDQTEGALFGEQFRGSLDRRIQNSGLSAYRNKTNMIQRNSTSVKDEQDRFTMQTQMTTSLQEAMAPLGSDSMLRSIIDELQDIEPGDDEALAKVISRAGSGINNEELLASIRAPIADIHSKRKKITDLQSQILKAPEGEGKQRLLDQLSNEEAELRKQAVALDTMTSKYGMSGGGGLNIKDFERMQRAQAELHTSVGDLSGIRSGKYDNISAADIESAKQSYVPGQITRGQAEAVLRARAQDPQAPIDPADIDREVISGKINDQASGLALAKYNLANTPLRGSEERVQQLMTANPKLTLIEARDIADTEQRGKRLGVKKDFTNPQEGMKETKKALLEAELSRYEVTEKELNEEANTLRAGFTDPEELQRFNDNVQTPAGAAELTNSILRKRQAQDKQRFARFFSTEDGYAFRHQTDTFVRNTDNVMMELIHDPNAAKKMGTGALDGYKRLQSIQRQRRELALTYAGNDMANLMAGNYTSLDTGTKVGAEKAAEITVRMRALEVEQNQVMSTLAEATVSGKKVSLNSPQQEALALMGKPGVDPDKLAPEDKEKLQKLTASVELSRRVTPAQEAQLSKFGVNTLTSLEQAVGSKDIADVVSGKRIVPGLPEDLQKALPVLKELGITTTDQIRDLKSVDELAVKRQKEMVEREQIDKGDLLQRFSAAYGLGKLTEDPKEKADLVSKIGSVEQMSSVETVLASQTAMRAMAQQALKTLDSSGGSRDKIAALKSSKVDGVDYLTKQLSDIDRSNKSDVEKQKAKFAFLAESGFNETTQRGFLDNYELQKQVGGLAIGRDGKIKDVGGAIDRITSVGQDKDAGPQRLELSGRMDIDITDRYAEFDAGMSYATPR